MSSVALMFQGCSAGNTFLRHLATLVSFCEICFKHNSTCQLKFSDIDDEILESDGRASKTAFGWHEEPIGTWYEPKFRVEDVSSQATNLETARRGQKDSFWNNPQEQPHRSTKKLSEHFWGNHADADFVDFVSRHENSWEHILI